MLDRKLPFGETMDTHKKLIDLLKDFDTAMLVTRGDDRSLDARPMAVAQVDFATEFNQVLKVIGTRVVDGP